MQKSKFFVLLSFFNKNTFANILTIIILGICLWLPSFINPLSINSVSKMPFFEFLESIFKNLKFLSVCIAFLLLIAQSFYFNFIVIKHNLFAKSNYMVAFIFMFFMSGSSSLLNINVLSFAGFLIILQVDLLLSSYKKTEANNEVFYTGLISSLLMLVYTPFIVLQAYVLICIAIVRPINLRDYIVSIMGFIFPLLFVFTYYYWNESLDYFINKLLNIELLDSNFSQYSVQNLVYLFAIVFFLILSIFRVIIKGIIVKTMLVRKSFAFMYWLLCIGLFAGFFSDIAKVEGFAIIYIPLTILLCNVYINAKKLFWHELLFSAFFLLVAIKNFFYSF